MSDRTSVSLTVQTVNAAAAKEFFNWTVDKEEDNDPFTSYTFYDVNYGRLPFLLKLRQAGIAYDSEWDAGSEFGEGGEYCRFTDKGEVIIKEQYASDVNPILSSLMQLLDQPAALRGYIMAHHENLQMLPWDNQEEYGKKYLAWKLVMG